jgi:chromosome segregation and condensation protein ScpB
MSTRTKDDSFRDRLMGIIKEQENRSIELIRHANNMSILGKSNLSDYLYNAATHASLTARKASCAVAELDNPTPEDEFPF